MASRTEADVIAAIRPTIPASRLEREKPTPPKYDVAVLEAVILKETATLDSERLTTGALLVKIVENPEDTLETDTAVLAIQALRAVGLLAPPQKGERVEPTPAALRAVELLESVPTK